jgi:hypothetical protein
LAFSRKQEAMTDESLGHFPRRKAVRGRALPGLISLLLVLTMTSVARAQTPDPSRWGISASFAPAWTVPSNLKFFFDADTVDVDGSEFQIGVARGRTLGGDWGVSFVRKRVDDGSFKESTGQGCFNTTCFDLARRYTADNVYLNGVEVHKFVPFTTMRGRVQIGILFGGGFASVQGTTTVLIQDLEATGPIPQSGLPPFRVTDEISTVDGKTFMALVDWEPDYYPLGKVEIAVAGILAPGLKVRASGGFNFPGTQIFNIGFVYLFSR